MTYGQLFMILNPNVKVIENGTCVWIYFDSVSHDTLRVEWWNKEIPDELLKAQEQKWIPFVKRPLTEEEQKNHPGWCFILDGEVPDDEQEILLYRPWKNKDGYIIEMDRYINNGDTVYLEGAMDIENGMFWMPLPEPPKEEKQK